MESLTHPLAAVAAGSPREARRGLLWLATSMFLGMATWFSASAVGPQLSAVHDLSRSGSAWLTLGVQVGFVLGALVLGLSSAADRFGARHLMCAGATSAAVVNLVLLTATDGWQVICLRIVTGMCLAAVYPPGMKAVSTWFLTSRSTAIAVMIAALTLGSAAPHLVAAVTPMDWRLVVVITSCTSAMGAFTALVIASDGPFSFPMHTFRFRETVHAFRAKPVLLTSLGYFGHMWELYAMWSWFAVFIDTVLHDNAVVPARASLLTFVVISVGALGCLAGGRLAVRLGSARTAMWSMVFSGMCAVSIGWFVDAPAWVVVTIGLVWGFWAIADSAQFSALITHVADQRYVGSVLTLQMALGYLVTVPIGWGVPLLVDRGSWGLAFMCVAAGPALGALAMRQVVHLTAADHR